MAKKQIITELEVVFQALRVSKPPSVIEWVRPAQGYQCGFCLHLSRNSEDIIHSYTCEYRVWKAGRALVCRD